MYYLENNSKNIKELKLARVEPDTVSLTAFNHLTLRIFLQGVSLAAKLRFVN